ncbi:MAG: MFS transporter [Oscillospiraceae bacterium]|nr:MFS transporter [Oscillospiraceae bacterium]
MKKIRYYWLFVLGKLRQHFFMQYPETEKDWAISRLGYLINSAASTAVSALLSGSFIAALLRELGVSDALNGIFSTIPTIAALSQLIMLEITKHIQKAKLPTIISCFLGRAMYGVMVFIPFLDIPSGVRTGVFLALYVISSLLFQFVSPCSAAWLVSLLPTSSKGRFIGIKDTITMVSGGVFSLIGAGILDHFTSLVKAQTGFAIIGIMVFALTVIDSVGLNICKEPKVGTVYLDENREAVGRLARRNASAEKKKTLIQLVSETLHNKGFRKVIYIYIFWQASYYICVPFLNIYHISDLGLKYTFINGAMLAAKVICAVVFPYAGKLADRISYMFVARLGVIITAVSYLVGALCMPGAFSSLTFVIYQILYFIGTGVFGIGIASILYSVMPDGDKSSYFAVNSTSNSIIGVIFTFLAGIIMDSLQKTNVVIFGVHIYAQQILCFAGAIGLVAMVFFLSHFCKELETNDI